MSCWRATGLGLLAAAAVAVNGAAMAQPMLASSDAVACLTLVAGAPPLVYPEELLRRKDGGTVRVALQFEAADQPPRVTVLDEDWQNLDGLEASVRAHVRHLRVPCMPAGSPAVVLRRDYVFVPNDGRKVVASRARDAADQVRHDQLTCIAHLTGLKRPDYPAKALQEEWQGNVYLRLRFESSDQPPKFEVLASPHRSVFEMAVRNYIEDLRMPCWVGGPVELTQLYKFAIEGGRRTLLKDLSLQHLLRAARDVPTGVYFDLNQMHCPFSLRLGYFRPHEPNQVSEIDTTHPERLAFIDWLSKITLDLPPERNTELLGQSITVEVPCGTVDL